MCPNIPYDIFRCKILRLDKHFENIIASKRRFCHLGTPLSKLQSLTVTRGLWRRLQQGSGRGPARATRLRPPRRGRGRGRRSTCTCLSPTPSRSSAPGSSSSPPSPRSAPLSAAVARVSLKSQPLLPPTRFRSPPPRV